jgi:hypothetical protein
MLGLGLAWGPTNQACVGVSMCACKQDDGHAEEENVSANTSEYLVDPPMPRHQLEAGRSDRREGETNHLDPRPKLGACTVCFSCCTSPLTAILEAI